MGLTAAHVGSSAKPLPVSQSPTVEPKNGDSVPCSGVSRNTARSHAVLSRCCSRLLSAWATPPSRAPVASAEAPHGGGNRTRAKFPPQSVLTCLALPPFQKKGADLADAGAPADAPRAEWLAHLGLVSDHRECHASRQAYFGSKQDSAVCAPRQVGAPADPPT